MQSDLSNSKAKLAAAAVAAATVAAALYHNNKKFTDHGDYYYHLVGHVEKICIYPVKSCAGISVEAARCTPFGFEHIACSEKNNNNSPPPQSSADALIADRRYMIITSRDHLCVTQRTRPELAHISVDYDRTNGDMILTSAKTDRKLRIQHYWHWPGGWQRCVSYIKHKNNTQAALDCGDAAAQWLSECLRRNDDGQAYRLAVYPVEFGGISAIMKKTDAQLGNKLDKTAFTDQSSYMLLNTSSLQALNKILAAKSAAPVDYVNFRPGIVVRPIAERAEPFAEDDWNYIKVVSSSSHTKSTAQFRNYRPSERCVLTTVDQRNGIIRDDGEPLKTLREIRLAKSPRGREAFKQAPLFCLNLLMPHFADTGDDNTPIVRVGDAVYATLGNANRDL